jgi:hypothetical protein
MRMPGGQAGAGDAFAGPRQEELVAPPYVAGGWQANVPGPAPRPQVRGDAEPAVARFSASDLIDPQALPGWVQRSGAQQPEFSSAAGWSGPPPDGLHLDPAGQQAAFDEQQDTYVGGGPQPTDLGRQTGAFRSVGENAIPQGELPPWLQGSQSGGAERHARGLGGDRHRLPESEEVRGPFAAPQDADWEGMGRGAGYGPDPDLQPGTYADPYTHLYDDYEDVGVADMAYGSADGSGYAEEYGGGYAEEYGGEYGTAEHDGAAGAWQQWGDDPPEAEGKRGGWRRLFGRR